MNPDRLLRTTLSVNALSSGVLGLAIAVAAAPLSGWLGVPSWILVVLGVGLALFALLVWRIRGRAELRPVEIGGVFVADVAWVLASGVVLLTASGLTTAGRWAVVVLAVVVADYALLEWIGLRRLGASSPRAASPSTP